MDLHVYRNSQDRWHDLKTSAVRQGAVLAVNAVTLDELVEKLTPDIQVASAGQRLASILKFQDSCISSSKVEIVNRSAIRSPISSLEPDLQESCYLRFFSARYAYDAVSELKACRIRSSELRASGAAYLADVLDHYDRSLGAVGLYDPQDRYALAASRVREDRVDWLERFERVVLHTLYDLTEAEFMLVRSLIEKLPDGGAVVLFNTTANVKPTQFAEWDLEAIHRKRSAGRKNLPGILPALRIERGPFWKDCLCLNRASRFPPTIPCGS
jgi:hypothetical protein